ncbi:MAG: TraR/DksA C4-type zinc finger protein [Bdellovibrionota bacterium]
MNKTELTKFRKRLESDKRRILELADNAENEEQKDQEEIPLDEVDIASNEVNRAINRRLRDRERVLLNKIEKSIKRIEEGTYNECESCGGPIGAKRLEARPVTTLCITCKEEQERKERGIAR